MRAESALPHMPYQVATLCLCWEGDYLSEPFSTNAPRVFCLALKDLDSAILMFDGLTPAFFQDV